MLASAQLCIGKMAATAQAGIVQCKQNSKLGVGMLANKVETCGTGCEAV